LNPERWAQIEELFHRAAECAPEQRARLLDRECADDSQLRREVEELLGNAEGASAQMREAVFSALDAVEFPLIGQTISHYLILAGLGGGGMGRVYRAEDVRLGRQVALKFLPEESASDPVALRRFEREARAASALEHPNICPIYEFGEHEGQSFLVMQLLDGETLRELIPATGAPQTALPLESLLDYAVQIAQGLAAAHSKGIIHRDIKPANIFVTRQGQIKILDFGLAKIASAQVVEVALNLPDAQSSREERAESSQPALGRALDLFVSRTGSTMGTAGYMSPEQLRGEDLDARTDLFSFGLVLYEMATGRRAFAEITAQVLRDAILHRQATPARELNPQLPLTLDRIIRKALEKDCKLRYQSATEILTDLERVKKTRRPGSVNAASSAVAAASARLANRRWRALVYCSIAVICIAAGSFAYSLRHRRANRLTGQDTLVLADFANTTGDIVFDGTLRQALAIQLQQSPFLNPLSDEKVSATLKLMNRPPNERLTQDIAREICLRANGKALLAGSIAREGTQYSIDLKATTCDTGGGIGTTHAIANSRQDVLKALDDASNSMRQKLGESLASVERFDKPLDQATTSSLEALQAFSEGQKLSMDKGSAEAIPYYKKAVALDPNFAYAYAAMATSYANLKEGGLAADNSLKAYELRDRVGERERFYIEADLNRTEDTRKYIEIYHRWIEAYPGDALPHLNLGNTYASLGQHEKAAEETRTYLRMRPDSQLGYANLIEDYLWLNRVDEAKDAAERAIALRLDGFYLRVARYSLCFVQSDEAGMKEQLAWAIGKPGAEDSLLSDQSDTYAYSGRLANARKFSRDAVESAIHADEAETAAIWHLDAALREAEFGNSDAARGAIADGLALAPDRDTELLAALAFARIGDVVQAQKLVEKIGRQPLKDTLVVYYWLPAIRAAIEIDRRDATKAIELLKPASEYDMGASAQFVAAPMYPAYVRGLAYLKMRKGAEAVTEFQRIIEHRGAVQNFPLGALAHLQLARARVINGDVPGGRTAYQDFFALWKDADPDIPILLAAKSEYAKLK